MSEQARQNRRARRAALAGRRFATLALSLADGAALPTSFPLFAKGWNETENGKFLFDDVAARSVMSAYRKWGVDVMIDLEHQMLEVEGGAADPTARDARGWCKLELRADGSLWATDVRWTPDGAQRLAEKRQRYVSPAFDVDPKTGRVLKLVNVAITALPATHKTPALVAASRKGTSVDLKKTIKLAAEMGLDPDLVKQALDAIEAGDDDAARTILKNMIAAAAGAPAEPDGDEPGAEGDGAEGVAPPAEAESVEDPKVVANDAADGDGDDKEDEDDDKAPPAKKAERKAMRLMLCRLAGKKSFPEAVAEAELWRASHMTLETERKQLARERAVLESAERRSLVTALIKCGAEFPSTVWANDKATAIKSRWLKMPIAELRAHVSEQRAVRGKKVEKPTTDNVQPPDPSSVEVVLSAADLQICKETNCDPAVFAKLKAARDQGVEGYLVALQARETNARAQLARAGKGS